MRCIDLLSTRLLSLLRDCCHSERSEESRRVRIQDETLRSAQSDTEQAPLPTDCHAERSEESPSPSPKDETFRCIQSDKGGASRVVSAPDALQEGARLVRHVAAGVNVAGQGFLRQVIIMRV